MTLDVGRGGADGGGTGSSMDFRKVRDFLSVNHARQKHVWCYVQGPAYAPQVEAISPTPEDQPDATGVSRAQIAEKLEKVEREIRGVDQQIKNLERKKVPLTALLPKRHLKESVCFYALWLVYIVVQ